MRGGVGCHRGLGGMGRAREGGAAFPYRARDAMFDIGFQEILLILVITLLVFGPKRLPELGQALGRAIREFRRASEEFRSQIERDIMTSQESTKPEEPASVTSEVSTAREGAEPTLLEGSPLPSEVAPGTHSQPGVFTEAPASATSSISEQPLPGLVAAREGRLVHRGECDWVGKIAKEQRLPFNSFEEARGQGYRACPVCDPKPASPDWEGSGLAG